MKKYLLFLFSLSLFAVGCASKQVTLKSSEIVPLNQLEKSIPFTRVSGNLKIGSFSDKRTKTDSIGVAKTGLMNREAPIKLDISTEEYVRSRFLNGLAKRGVDVIGNSKYAIQGEIKKLWVWEEGDGLGSEHSNCEIQIDFDVVTSKWKKQKYHATVSANALGTSSIFDTTSSDGSVLEICMNYIVEKFVEEPQLQALLKFKIQK